MLCSAVCKFSVYVLILSITFDSFSYFTVQKIPLRDLSYCGISYSFSHVVSSDFYCKLFKDFHVCLRCLLKRAVPPIEV